jgi:hypothetical protein
MTNSETHFGERLAAVVASSSVIVFVWGCSGGDTASPSLERETNFVAPGADAGGDVAVDDVHVAPASCPRGEAPDACPSPPPSWFNSARIIVETKCSPCHLPGGADDPQIDYSSYQRVNQGRGEMFLQVDTCAMPPSDAAALTLTERDTLLAWLICGAPDN